MYRMTDEQLNTMSYIVNNLTVTGPVQGGYLNHAGGILEMVRKQKVEIPKKKGEIDKCQ